MMTESMFTTSDGVELFVRTEPVAQPRFDVLIVHGIAEHSGRWIEVARRLQARGGAVSMFDIRGHGRSGGPDHDLESVERIHTDISEVAASNAAASGRPWVLYGHSWGGLFCAGYLIDRHTPTPNVAVLSAPALDSNLPGFLKTTARVLGGITGGVKVDSTIEGDQLSRDPKVGEAYFADELVDTKATLRLGSLTLAEMKRVTAHAGDIVTPTLVVHGADDDLVPPSASAPLARSNAVERRVLPGLRHETHNEPEGAHVTGDIIDWIERKIG